MRKRCFFCSARSSALRWMKGLGGVVLFAAAMRSVAGVVVDELMYDPLGGGNYEFIELQNTGSNAVSLAGWFFSDGINYRFSSNEVLEPQGYLVVVADCSAFGARYPTVTCLAAGAYSGHLSNEGERLALCDVSSNLVFKTTYNNKAPWPEEAAGLGSSLILVDPTAPPNEPTSWRASETPNGSPGEAGSFFARDVVINEVLAHTDPPQEDAVELYNLTTNAVDLSGWFLSDNALERKKYCFPAGTVLLPKSYLVVYQYQMMGTDSLVPFSISSKGDDLYLSEADENGTIIRYANQVKFDPTKNGVCIGRVPDGTGNFERLATPTFGVSSPNTLEEFRTGRGARNAGAWIGPVVINEIMYHPADSDLTGHMETEYIELFNRSSKTVALYNTEHPSFTWSLAGGINYSFPPNITMQPGEYLLVIATNDVTGFRAEWNLPANLQILASFSNALDNAGDTVKLCAPNNPEPPDNLAAYHVEDEVKYNDRLPWPLGADGRGGALERIDPSAYANTAENWHSTPTQPTPGTLNSDYVEPGAVVISEIMAVNRHTLRDDDNDFSDWIELYNTRSYDISLKGWHLSDRSADPTLWTFPEVTLPAHGYLVVFASGKDRTNNTAELHTNFSLADKGEYLGLFRPDLTCEFAFDPTFPPQFADVAYGFAHFGSRTQTPVKEGTSGRYLVPDSAADLAADWMNLSFNDVGWRAAINGLGYDLHSEYRSLISTDLQDEMFNRHTSGFIRFPFVISDSDQVNQMILRVKYDDGFICWLNGVRIKSGLAPETSEWDSTSTGAHDDSQAKIFKVYDLSNQSFRLLDGTNILAFQTLNHSADSSDLLLLPELELGWSGISTGTVDQAVGYLLSASPGNFNGEICPAVTPPPTLSHSGGLFSGSLSVTVSCTRADAELRYTLDGSTPTTTSLLYTTPLHFSTTTELRVRSFLQNHVPSPIVGAVYQTHFLGINEFLASNATTTPEIADFSAFPDWIELYNASSSDISIGGYHLSDDINQPFRWRIPDGTTIPANGYLLVWADGYDSRPGLHLKRPFWPYASFTTRSYHSNFKLSASGEEIGLFSPSGSQIDAISFSAQSTDISCGRCPDGSEIWRYFGEPTPCASNQTLGLSHAIYHAPPVTIFPTNSPLIVTGSVQVVLSAPPPATEIRYTLGGAQPTSSSTLYTAPFSLPTGGVIRARSYAPNAHPGPVTTRTFLYQTTPSDLPMISLVIDPDLLFGDVHGIYTNLLKQREVPGNLQFFIDSNRSTFQIDAGFRLFGLNTFLFAQKPLTVYLKGKYGCDQLAYPLFPDKPLGFFDRFVLRNGNDDWAHTFLRDTLGQKILNGGLVNATQGFRPCAIYLNGIYYGLINIQEKMDEMYCAKNYDLDLEKIDFFENDGASAEGKLDAGSAEAWNDLLDFLHTHSLANSTNYDYAKTQVDLEDMVDYVAGQTFMVDIGWLHNRKWWRERVPKGKWRWCFVDLDRAMDLDYINNDQLSDMAVHMEIFKEFLDQSEFRSYCAQRIMAHLNSTFNPAKTLPVIDEEAAKIRPEMAAHIALYGSQGGIPSLAEWESRLDDIRDYARRRPAIAMQQVADYFSGGNLADLTVEIDGGAGCVLVNEVALSGGTTNRFLAGIPLRLTARPAIGQRFIRWEQNATILSTDSSLTWTPSGTETLHAVFAPDTSAHLLPEMILSNTVLSALQSPYYTTGDLFIPSNITLSVEAGVEIRMPEAANIRVQGHLRVLGLAAQPVQILSNPNASTRNSMSTGVIGGNLRWGAICFERATGVGELNHLILRGASRNLRDPIHYKAAISALDSDLQMDHLDLDEVGLPIFVKGGQSTVLLNSHLHFRQTGDAINVKRATFARIENCTISGGESVDADAIDFDGLSSGIISSNYLHNFEGDNDDALDIGEGTQNLLIQSNRISHISDKGISVGQTSKVTIQRNLIRNCTIGVGIKDLGSFAEIRHNTFHNTDRGVAVYEKNPGKGGGSALIKNCIFSGTHSEPVFVDSLSTATSSFCLSDSLPIQGTENALGEPLFEQPKIDNFRLQTGSPAIDAGDPSTPSDPDGTRADIGAMPFDWREGHLVIAEIHYHPSQTNQSEFIQLYNVGGATLDLTGWHFSKGIDFHFPNGLQLQPEHHLVLAAHTNQLSTSLKTLSWTAGILDNMGETLEILDASSNEIDQVSYRSGYPWPIEADGEGFSLLLRSPRMNNTLASSWTCSAITNETPNIVLDDLTPGSFSAHFISATTLRIICGGVPGILYQIEYAPTLQDLWTPINTPTPAMHGKITIEHTPNTPEGFYRIHSIQP